MNGPLRFQKRPVEVEAMQWLGAPSPSILPSATRVIDWVLANGGTARYIEAQVETKLLGKVVRPAMPEHLAIDTLEGTMRALPGDYIIRGVQGEFYPCKPDIFRATYDDGE